MGISHPLEVEAGQLVPDAAPGPPEPLDLSARLSDAVEAYEDGITLFGVRLVVPSGQEPAATAHSFRRAIAERLRERRPNANVTAWHALETISAGQLSSGDLADEQTLRKVLAAVDGL